MLRNGSRDKFALRAAKVGYVGSAFNLLPQISVSVPPPVKLRIAYWVFEHTMGLVICTRWLYERWMESKRFAVNGRCFARAWRRCGDISARAYSQVIHAVLGESKLCRC